MEELMGKRLVGLFVDETGPLFLEELYLMILSDSVFKSRVDPVRPRLLNSAP
jgi:hypothetical protein